MGTNAENPTPETDTDDDVTGFGAYMKLDGPGVLNVVGPQTTAGDANHDKWIDVLSIDWGSHRPGGG